MSLAVCVVSCLGERSYAEKVASLSEIHRGYWNDNLLWWRGQPLDVLDHHLASRAGPVDQLRGDRHVYMNGVVIGNYLARHGFRVTLVNSGRQLVARPARERFDWFVLSTTFEGGHYETLLDQTLGFIRSHHPEAKIVVGGLGVYRAYLAMKAGKPRRYQALLDRPIDSLVVSAGGLSGLPDILHGATDTARVVVDEAPRPLPADYSVHGYPQELQCPHSALLASVGCPHRCAFCCYSFMQRGYSANPLAWVQNNLDQIASARRSVPLRFLRMADDCLNHDQGRFMAIVDGLRRANLRWCCFARGDQLCQGDIDALAGSRCDFVSIGVESASPRVLATLGKPMDLARLSENVGLLRSAGVAVVLSVVLGSYGETEATVRQTVDYLCRVQPDLVKVNIWTPLPGEDRLPAARQHGFAWHQGRWRHATMALEEAHAHATRFFHKNRDLTVLPPETSIFDQWPQLAAEGVGQAEIIQVFRRYHVAALASGRDHRTAPSLPTV